MTYTIYIIDFLCMLMLLGCLAFEKCTNAVRSEYSASSVIQTSDYPTLVYPNSQKLVKFHEFHYNLQDSGHLVM